MQRPTGQQAFLTLETGRIDLTVHSCVILISGSASIMPFDLFIHLPVCWKTFWALLQHISAVRCLMLLWTTLRKLYNVCVCVFLLFLRVQTLWKALSVVLYGQYRTESRSLLKRRFILNPPYTSVHEISWSHRLKQLQDLSVPISFIRGLVLQVIGSNLICLTWTGQSAGNCDVCTASILTWVQQSLYSNSQRLPTLILHKQYSHGWDSAWWSNLALVMLYVCLFKQCQVLDCSWPACCKSV